MAGRPQWLVDLVRPSGPRRPVSPWSLALDAVIAAATAVCFAEVAVHAHGGGALVHVYPTGMQVSVPVPVAGLPPASTLLTDLLTTAPLALRRRYPLAACVVILAAVVSGAHGQLPAVAFATAVLAVYSAVVYSPFPQLAVGSALIAVIAATLASPDTLPKFPARFTALIAFAPTLAVALGMRSWRRRASDSAARLRRAEAEHEAATLRALATERARIAAELHDVVTHNVSVMMVQAGAARQVLATSPAEARDALLAVEASGRTAMAELRALLGLLSPCADDAGALLRPQPGLASLDELIERVSAAGLKVDLHASGLRAGLPPGLDLAAYRVVQEGLTNVIKHGGRAQASVRLSHRLGELVITVTDDGPVSDPTPAPPGRTPTPAPAGRTPTPAPAGRGLIGLRERLALYGGSLDAGPRPGGGWRLRARVPLEA